MECLGPESSLKEDFVAPVLLGEQGVEEGRAGRVSVEAILGWALPAQCSVAHPSGELRLAPSPEGDKSPISGVSWSETIPELPMCQCQGFLTAHFEGRRGAELSSQRCWNSRSHHPAAVSSSIAPLLLWLGIPIL